MELTYYSLLGLSSDATDEQIKKAYRAKARQQHPDSGGDSDLFILVRQAFETLRDPQARAVYDASLEAASGRASTAPRPTRQAADSPEPEPEPRWESPFAAAERAREEQSRLNREYFARYTPQDVPNSTRTRPPSRAGRYQPVGTLEPDGTPRPRRERLRQELSAIRADAPSLFTPSKLLPIVKELRKDRAVAAGALGTWGLHWWLWLTLPATMLAFMLVRTHPQHATLSGGWTVLAVLTGLVVSGLVGLLHLMRAHLAPMAPWEMIPTWLAVACMQVDAARWWDYSYLMTVGQCIVAAQVAGLGVLALLPGPFSAEAARRWRAWFVEIREEATLLPAVRKILREDFAVEGTPTR